jgi:hypothetical protein
MFLSSATLHGPTRPATDDGAAAHDWTRSSMLLVSYDWNPLAGGPEALAGRRLASALLDAGARVHVLTADGGTPIEADRYHQTVVADTPAPDNRVQLGLGMIRHRIPEPYFNWVRHAVPAGERVLAGLPSDAVIYGRAMPGASNIVAWHLARKSGRPLVAHFSDEWPSVQLVASGATWAVPYKTPLFRLWRRRIFRDAGALTFTNPDQAVAVLERVGAYARRKSFVVTHLAGRERRPGSDVAPRTCFHILHTGNLNPPGHTAAAFMHGLRLFIDRRPDVSSRIRFTQAGWSPGDNPEWIDRFDLGRVAHVVGRVSPAAVIDLLDRASLLVGFDYARRDSATLLSKLPDYVASGRPILVLTSPGSAMGRLFSRDAVGLTAMYDSAEEVAACLAQAYDAWQAGSDAWLPGPVAVESFSRHHVLGELAAAVATARRGSA